MFGHDLSALSVREIERESVRTLTTNYIFEVSGLDGDTRLRSEKTVLIILVRLPFCWTTWQKIDPIRFGSLLTRYSNRVIFLCREARSMTSFAWHEIQFAYQPWFGITGCSTHQDGQNLGTIKFIDKFIRGPLPYSPTPVPNMCSCNFLMASIFHRHPHNRFITGNLFFLIRDCTRNFNSFLFRVFRLNKLTQIVYKLRWKCSLTS